MQLRTIKKGGYGVNLNLGQCTSLGIMFLVPKEECEIQAWNWVGIQAFIGPVYLFGFELSSEKVSLILLNSYISFIWGC